MSDRRLLRDSAVSQLILNGRSIWLIRLWVCGAIVCTTGWWLGLAWGAFWLAQRAVAYMVA